MRVSTSSACGATRGRASRLSRTPALYTPAFFAPSSYKPAICKDQALNRPSDFRPVLSPSARSLRWWALAVTAGAVLLGDWMAEPASANACAAACRAQHNQCRIQTKGSASCDAALQRCLQGCLRR